MQFFRRGLRSAATFYLLLFSFVASIRAQQTINVGAPEAMRSSAFTPLFEASVEQSLDGFRARNDIALSDEEFSELQSSQSDDYGIGDQLLSLDLFRSLAAYLRNRPFDQQARIDDILSNASPVSDHVPKAALLGALEFYSHFPLRRIDVDAGLARLTEIPDAKVAEASIQAEIHFWKAEGYSAIGELDLAEKEYRSTIDLPDGPRLRALADFRLAELLEREQRYAEADTAFTAASRIRENPLMLLALLRLGSVERSEKNYEAVLNTMQIADSVFRTVRHDVRSSARDARFASNLIEELMGEDDHSAGTSSQLVSPFCLSEIALLRGSAENGLGKYDEANEILTNGQHIVDSEEHSATYLNSGSSVAQIPSALISEEAIFVSDALKFERGWSLFQRAKYQEAAGAFLQLSVSDTGSGHHALIQEATLGLREQGLYFDKFYNDSLSRSQVPVLDRSVLSKIEIDTSFFIYNDYAERSRYYAGVALARAGMLDESADVLEKLVVDKNALYSNLATYQLALIRFKQHNYSAQTLLEPLSYEQSSRGAFASFLLGELAYRRNYYERAEGYFQNAFANLSKEDTVIIATAHLERGLSLIPLGAWQDAASELTTFLNETHDTIAGRTDEALFWLGKAFFRAGEFDSSRVIFTRLLKEFPKSNRFGDATYGYAWSLFQSNDFRSAEPAFEKVIALDSITRYAYDALTRAGDSYYSLGDVKNANKLYNLAVDRPAFNEFRTTRALLMLGVTRMKLDSDRGAMNEFKYLTMKFPKSDIVDLAYFNWAIAAYSLNLSADAEDIVEKLARHYHNSTVTPRALYVAGEERVRRGDASGSVRYYKEVINDFPHSHEASLSLFALQDALAELNRIPEALAVADTFAQNNPNNPIIPMVLLRAGEFKMKMHDAYGATANFQKFLTNYPGNPARPRAELLLAQSELASGDTTLALSQLDTVISKYDSLDVAAQAYLERARVEEKRKQFENATRDFQIAFADKYYSCDASPEAMFEYAEMLAAEKQTDSAIAGFSNLAIRYPIEASIVARSEIRSGELLASERKWDDSRNAFGIVIRAHPKDLYGGAATVRIGETLLHEANWLRAADTFAYAKDNFPLSSESEFRTMLGLAKADSHLGRNAEAIRKLKALLAMRGVPGAIRYEAASLLHILQPPEKKNRKKGARPQ